MTKALKEAKLNTSWIQPNEPWDTAMREFVAAVLDPARKRFVPSFAPVVEEIARLGAINSLSQLVLKLTSPGVPDIYQGNETWDFSLVDPDNRQPVDYQARRQMLAGLTNTTPEELLSSWPDGRIKLFVTHRLLRFRREHPALFRHGNYTPLRPAGVFGECCVAFAREREGEWLIVLAPRVSSRLGFPATGDRWLDTALELPEAAARARAIEVFTGGGLRSEGNSLRLSEAMRVLPFAVYTSVG